VKVGVPQESVAGAFHFDAATTAAGATIVADAAVKSM
jgi:hypothetical protein